jgi:hypothetical protein
MDPSQPDLDAATGKLDLEQAQFGGASGQTLTCAHCGVPIGDEYYTLGDAVHCPRCQDSVQALLAKGPGMLGCMRAFGFGGAAALVGATLWAGVTQVTGYELGIIAIAVGWLVGVAVRAGSRGIGGVPYQVLAIALTYLAIVVTYVPLILDTWASTPVEELMGEDLQGEESFAVMEEVDGQEVDARLLDDVEWTADAEGDAALVEVDVEVVPGDDELYAETSLPVDENGELVIDAGLVVGAFVLALALPFMMGLENAIGVLIIGIALWEAWRQTRRAQIEIGGPFRVGSQPTA